MRKFNTTASVIAVLAHVISVPVTLPLACIIYVSSWSVRTIARVWEA